jgi:hypothetical protein
MGGLSWTVCLAVSCMLLDCHCRHRHGCGDAALLKSWGCSYVCLRRGFDAMGIDSGSSSRLFNSRCGGVKLRSGRVSQANTFAFVGQYEKVLPCTGLAFARHYSLGTWWRISREFRSCARSRVACAAMED